MGVLVEQCRLRKLTSSLVNGQPQTRHKDERRDSADRKSLGREQRKTAGRKGYILPDGAGVRLPPARLVATEF